MVNTKVNLVIILPGSTMLSERDCSKEIRKPVISQNGKYAGKQKKDKDGNPLFKTVLVPDPDKVNHHSIRISYEMNGEKRVEKLEFSTRGTKPARQSLNICEEAYDYMTGTEAPEGFRFPRDFKPNKVLARKGMSLMQQAWNTKSKKEKLEWHLSRICADRGGTLGDYTIFDD